MNRFPWLSSVHMIVFFLFLCVVPGTSHGLVVNYDFNGSLSSVTPFLSGQWDVGAPFNVSLSTEYDPSISPVFVQKGKGYTAALWTDIMIDYNMESNGWYFGMPGARNSLVLMIDSRRPDMNDFIGIRELGVVPPSEPWNACLTLSAFFSSNSAINNLSLSSGFLNDLEMLKIEANNWYACISDFGTDDVDPGDDTAPVPEPATMMILGAGMLSLAGYKRKLWSKN